MIYGNWDDDFEGMLEEDCKGLIIAAPMTKEESLWPDKGRRMATLMAWEKLAKDIMIKHMWVS